MTSPVRPARSSGADRNARPDRGPRTDRTDRGPRTERPQRTAPAAPVAPVAQYPAAQTEELPSFAELGLSRPLVDALARRGFERPFPIQAVTLRDALAGKDVLGRGRTGSGKTLAFGLPVLDRLAAGRAQSRRPRALVLVPTRELATQVSDALEPLAHAIGLKVRPIIGGASFPKQREALSRGVDLIVATPGRLTDLVEQGACRLDQVEVAVLDEADHMADMGFMPAVTALLDQIPVGGQRLLFSATLDREVDKLVRRYLQSPVSHGIDDPTGSVSTMEHHLLVVRPEDKLAVTAEIAGRDGRTILFVRTKHGADRLALQLTRQGVPAAALHGGKTQGARTRTLADFREGRVPALVATDVAARGIHVDGISLVVHVDPPADPKDYLHRAGRTARAGESGTVVTIVLPKQQREVDAMARRAGVEPARLRVRPGDADLTELTGARAPSGVPVPSRASASDTKPPWSARREGSGRRRPGGPGNRPASGGAARSSGRTAGRTAGKPAGSAAGKPAGKSRPSSSAPGLAKGSAPRSEGAATRAGGPPRAKRGPAAGKGRPVRQGGGSGSSRGRRAG